MFDLWNEMCAQIQVMSNHSVLYTYNIYIHVYVLNADMNLVHLISILWQKSKCHEVAAVSWQDRSHPTPLHQYLTCDRDLQDLDARGQEVFIFLEQHLAR